MFRSHYSLIICVAASLTIAYHAGWGGYNEIGAENDRLLVLPRLWADPRIPGSIGGVFDVQSERKASYIVLEVYGALFDDLHYRYVSRESTSAIPRTELLVVDIWQYKQPPVLFKV